MSSQPKLLAIGLNPAYQRTLVFDHLAVGEVNRAVNEVISPGGKAVHCAIAANTMFPGSATVAAFYGGETGKAIQRQLADLGTPSIGIRVNEATRTCTTLVDQNAGVSTELVGPSAPVSANMADQMRDMLLAALPGFDALALCGTYPSGIDEALFIELAEAHGNKPLMLDAFRGVDRLLTTGRVNVLKINRQEAAALTGASEPAAIAKAAFEQFALDALLLTDGPDTAWVFEPDSTWQIQPPRIHVLNPIGAGDTCAGVTMARWLHGDSLPTAFAAGLAAASASCLTLTGGQFDPAEAQRLAAEAVSTHCNVASRIEAPWIACIARPQ